MQQAPVPHPRIRIPHLRPEELLDALAGWVASSLPPIQHLRQPPQHIQRTPPPPHPPRRRPPRRFSKRLLRQPVRRSLGRTERVDTVRELINRKLQILRDILQPLLDGRGIFRRRLLGCRSL